MKIYKLDTPELNSTEIKTISQHLRNTYATASSSTEAIARPSQVIPYSLGTIVLSDNLERTINNVSELKDIVDTALAKFKRDDYGNIPESIVAKNIRAKFSQDGSEMFGAYETEFGWIQLDTMACDNKNITLVSLMRTPKPDYIYDIKSAIKTFVRTTTKTVEK